MTVLHIFTKYPNPYQPYNQKLIERQKMAGINCLVFSFPSSNKSWRRTAFFILKGLCHVSLVRKFKRESNRTLLQSIILVGVVRPIIKSKADIFHIHHSQCLTTDYQLLFSMLNVPCVVSLRGSDALVTPLIGPQNLISFKNILQFVDGIHTVSKHLAKVAESYGATPNKIKAIPRTPDEIIPIKRNVDYSNGPFNITSIGRLHWTKGFIYLVQCIEQLRSEDFDVVLNIIGDGNADVKTELIFWINSLNLNDSVILHGYQNAEFINGLLAQTHVYVQPSITEGIPNTLIKAVVNEIPIVASNAGGIPEIVSQNQGILVPPGNVPMLSNAIKKILMDNTFRDQLYKVQSTISFDPSQEINSYKEFYQSFLDR